jgi:hypothetical protein
MIRDFPSRHPATGGGFMAHNPVLGLDTAPSHWLPAASGI